MKHPHGTRDPRSGAPRLVATITQHELTALIAMSYGSNNAAIRQQLVLSEGGVKGLTQRIFRKLGATDRAHAVRVGFELGLLWEKQPREPAPVVGWARRPVTSRRAYVDRHIAACFAAESCPCHPNSTWTWPQPAGVSA